MSKNSKMNVIQDFQSVLRLIQSNAPALLPMAVIKGLLASGIPFVNLIFSSRILDGLIRQLGMEYLQTQVLWMLALNFCLGIAAKGLDTSYKVASWKLDLEVDAKIADKALKLDYPQIESQETMKLLHAAKEGTNSNGGLGSFARGLGMTIQDIISIGYAIALLVPFFTKGAVSSGASAAERFLASPLSGLCLLFCYLLLITAEFGILKRFKKLMFQFFSINVEGNRRFLYFYSQILLEHKAGKDVRIYNMKDLIANQLDANIMGKEAEEIFQKQAKSNSLCSAIDSILLYLAYLLVGIKALFGMISAAGILRYVGALTTFSQSCKSLTSRYSDLCLQIKYLSNYQEYFNLPNVQYCGHLPVEKRDDSQYQITFKDVSFSYPGSDEKILDHVSFDLNIGKKLAIVGPNGAGKTTFIKLLCRLYDQTEGEILLNGIDIRKYDMLEYRSLFSVVFQDFKLFSFDIGQNVAADLEYDEQRVWECMEKAGLKERVLRMDEGVHTLVSQTAEGGVEISGGEAQKLAIARALYKDAPIVILDEPTSALDPISEYEIYSRFDSLVENKTSIYISHRMSSCRFCDEILVFDQGRMVQRGNHDSLLKQEDGLYSRLWHAQAQYYQTEGEKKGA